MEELLSDASSRAIKYINGRETQRVYPDSEAIQGLEGFVEPMPDSPTDACEVLELLDTLGSPATVLSGSGRYFGFVTGGTQPIGLAASWLVTAWDQNAALGAMSPTAEALDTVAGRWLVSLFGLPQGTQPTFVCGASMANTTCLAAARDRLLADMGHDAVSDGLFGAPALRVIVSEACHSSVVKSLGFLGIGRNAVIRVEADSQGRMMADRLPEAGLPTLVVLQAGNVNSGAFDPFSAVADHFEGTPHWIHVDGAFGLWAAATDEFHELTEGIARAHSWAVDMHKWLNVSYDSAVALVRDQADLSRTFHVGASYLPTGERLDPVHRGPDMSQRARAVETWAVLKCLGRVGVAELISRCCRHAKVLAAGLQEAGFQVHNDVVLNQVVVSLDTDKLTEALLSKMSQIGNVWAGGSQFRGVKVMRLSVSGWASTDEDIQQAISTFKSLASDKL